jgi:hypothetical protein
MEKLKPPKGYSGWVEYAIATMDTRSVHLDTLFDQSYWGRELSREEIKSAVSEEWINIKEAISSIKKEAKDGLKS